MLPERGLYHLVLLHYEGYYSCETSTVPKDSEMWLTPHAHPRLGCAIPFALIVKGDKIETRHCARLYNTIQKQKIHCNISRSVVMSISLQNKKRLQCNTISAPSGTTNAYRISKGHTYVKYLYQLIELHAGIRFGYFLC